jgi:hypothetical protein
MIETARDPWFKWWPQSWRADPGLRMCSFAARGLWIDMLGLMHEAVPVGYLLVRGAAPTPAELASIVGGSEREITKLLSELEDREVFSRRPDGAIFSRKMVRDAKRREVNRNNGGKGGNPELMPDKPVSDAGITEPDNQSDKSRARAYQKPESRSQIPEASSLRSDDGPTLSSEVSQAIEEWNTLAEELDLPRAQRLTASRKSKLRARLKDVGGIGGWRAAMEKVREAAFLRGENDRGWKANLDFLLQESSLTKLMEGAYSGVHRTGDPWINAANSLSRKRTERMHSEGAHFDEDPQPRSPRTSGSTNGLRSVSDLLAGLTKGGA